MSWATPYIEKLRAGEIVSFRPRGRSMEPRVPDGALVTVQPASWHHIVVSDIVLCRVGGADFLHLVKRIEDDGGTTVYQIGNNKGRINGWARTVYGVCVKVEP